MLPFAEYHIEKINNDDDGTKQTTFYLFFLAAPRNATLRQVCYGMYHGLAELNILHPLSLYWLVETDQWLDDIHVNLIPSERVVHACTRGLPCTSREARCQRAYANAYGWLRKARRLQAGSSQPGGITRVRTISLEDFARY